MTDNLTLDPSRAALLIMDYQKGIIANYANDPALLERANQALGAARAAKIPVIYVAVTFRPGFPEISPKNPIFGSLKQSGRFSEEDPNTAVHPAVAPRDGDLTVSKRRVSAFAGSDLEMILRANGIETLVMFGIATSGVVLSTLRQAADLDYRCVVVKDLCADMDPEVHRVLTEKVFARQATVVNADEAIRAMSKP